MTKDFRTHSDYIGSAPRYEATIYDDSSGDSVLVARAKVIVDRKEIGKPIALVEDVWVNEDYRKQGFGKKIMEVVKDIAKQRDCYKAVLICADHNIPFYEKCGFYQHQKGMRFDV